MSVQHLAVGRPIAVPTGQVEVELVDFDTIGAEVAVVAAATGADLPSTVRLSPTRVVLAAPPEPAEVIASGPGGGPFPSGASVQVMVRIGQQPLRADLVGPRTDVGALVQPLLLTLAPEAGTIAVTAVKVDEAANPPAAEGPLPELARRAFYVARGSARAGDARRRGVVVCVDVSASMRAQVPALQCLLEVAFGIDRGMGDAGDVPAFAVTSYVRQLLPLTAGNLADYAAGLFATSPASERGEGPHPPWPAAEVVAGRRPASSAPEVAHSAAAGRAVLPVAGPESGCRAELLAEALGDLRRDRMVLLLTDEAPGDIDVCAEQWAADIAEWRVVVIGPQEDLLAASGLAGFGLSAVPPSLEYRELCDDVFGNRLLAELIARMTERQPSGAT